jgi:hypothetical protein
MTAELWFNSWQRQEIFLFYKVDSPWYPSLGLKRPGLEVYHSSSFSAEVLRSRISGVGPPFSSMPSWHAWDNFTLFYFTCLYSDLDSFYAIMSLHGSSTVELRTLVSKMCAVSIIRFAVP